MQTIDREQEWKDVHKKTILNESFVEVSLDITDPVAVADAEASDNGAIYISDSKSLTNGDENASVPYCTLEQNLWCLDGSRKAIPETSIDKTSFISDVLSDDTCVFSGKIPSITIDFDEIHPTLIPGITITWSSAYNEFAESFDVIAYKGDTIVASKGVTGNKTVKSLIFVDIAGYNKIVILIRKWCLPHHRARVDKVLVGIHKVYGKSELFDYSHSQVVDPISLSLPKCELRFSIDNIEGEYNPYNPHGLAKYLMERQEVKARYGLKLDDGTIEWIPGGTFFLSEWYAKQNGLTADFTARDLLELLSDIYYDKNPDPDYPNYFYFEERSLYDLATKVLNTAQLPLDSNGNVRWHIDESLKSITTYAPLPNDTRANCLQLIANAGMCVLYQDRKGILRIEPLKDEVEDYEINSFNSYSKSEVTLSKPIGKVVVKEYKYRNGANGIESETIDYYVDVGATGETIVLDNPLITYIIDDTGITDFPFVEEVGQWVGAYLSHRMTLDSSWRADVRLDVLDIVKNKNDYNTNRVRMTEVEFKYNGAFRGTGKGKVIGNG